MTKIESLSKVPSDQPEELYMKKHTCLFLFTIISTATSMFALENNDYKAINKIIDHFSVAWNHQQGQGFADYYTQDADFVNIFGMTFAGKQEIEVRHIKILESILKGSIFEVINVRLREAKPDLVIAHVNWKVSNIQEPGKEPLKETIKGVFTHVFLKNQDKWEIVATQNTLISN